MYVLLLALVATALAAPIETRLHQRMVIRNLKSFSFKDCGTAASSHLMCFYLTALFGCPLSAPSAAPIHANLSISPDPIRLPGNISIAASVGVVGNISSPIKATVVLEKKVSYMYYRWRWPRVKG